METAERASAIAKVSFMVLGNGGVGTSAGDDRLVMSDER